MKAGDVVFGVFAVKGESLADHHSVVVDISGDKAMLVYTTSIKPDEPVARRALSREFTLEERKMANWANRCRYDATQVAVVPVALLKKTGRVPAALVNQLANEIRLAAKDKRLVMNAYNPAHPERVTGHIARAKREAVYH